MFCEANGFITFFLNGFNKADNFLFFLKPQDIIVKAVRIGFFPLTEPFIKINQKREIVHKARNLQFFENRQSSLKIYWPKSEIRQAVC